MCNKVSDTYRLRQTQENVISAEEEEEFNLFLQLSPHLVHARHGLGDRSHQAVLSAS